MHELSDIYHYLRWKKRFPTVWCPGCGIGSILGAALRAIDDLKIQKDEVTFISGIGCTGRIPAYVDFNSMHTTHGRALAYATGVKMHRKDMNVIVASGDGDCLAIGGNHFIHAARRNIDITLILVNNSIYGMTGGQVAPTTHTSAVTHTTPYGNYETPFDPVKLALASGATFVARSTVYSIMQTTSFIKKAIKHKGFSMVEVISQCPVQYGRLNNMEDPMKLLLQQKENSVSKARAETMNEKELENKIITGIFIEKKTREYSSTYEEFTKNIQSELEE